MVKALMEKEEITVVTEFDGFMDALLPKEMILQRTLTITNAGSIHLDEIERQLAFIGYERESQVEVPGQFAVRGGILDIYPLTEELPVRIELWGDEVDSIRTFDVDSQRSIENLAEIRVYLADESFRRRSGEYLFLSILTRIHQSFFWMSRQGWWKEAKQLSRNLRRRRRSAWRMDMMSRIRKWNCTVQKM